MHVSMLVGAQMRCVGVTNEFLFFGQQTVAGSDLQVPRSNSRLHHTACSAPCVCDPCPQGPTNESNTMMRRRVRSLNSEWINTTTCQTYINWWRREMVAKTWRELLPGPRKPKRICSPNSTVLPPYARECHPNIFILRRETRAYGCARMPQLQTQRT